MKQTANRFRVHEVFRDFCELAALSFSNAVDRAQFDAREARYLQIIGRYERPEVDRFPAMLAELVQALERRRHDVLGELFMALELSDHWKGQFFTSSEIAALMARLTLGDVAAQVREQGFITVSEPACGAGSMVIAMADAIEEQGVSSQRSMHVTATDICATAVHMAYVQLSLLHIPAIVVHGNTLSLQEWGYWLTPAHVLGGWDTRLRLRALLTQTAAASDPEPSGLPAESSPQAEPTPDLAQLRTQIVETRLQAASQLTLFE